MIPAAFDYVRAESVEHAVGLLAEHGDDAKLLAGGQSLLPLMKLRLSVPALLVDLEPVRELAGIRVDGDALAIGARTRHADLVRSDLVREHAPLLGVVAGAVGDTQVRHRGTIGGSLAHADPAADLPAAALALDATLVAQGPQGRRRIAVDDFFTGFLETALAPAEVLVEIRVPLDGARGHGFEKFSRRTQDWAIVGVAATAGDRPRVALVSMGPAPMRARAVEDALRAGASPREAAELADAGTSPSEDLAAPAEYRRHLSRVLVRRALEAAQRTP